MDKNIKLFADIGIGNQIQFIPVIKELKKNNFNIFCNSFVYKDLIPEHINFEKQLKHRYDYGMILYSLGLAKVINAKKYCKKVIGFPFSFKIAGHKPIKVLNKLFYTKCFEFDHDKNEIENNMKLLKYFDIQYEKIDYSLTISKDKEKNVIGVSAGSGGHPEKRWANWVGLLDIIKHKEIRLFGTEISLNKRIKNKTKNKDVKIIETSNLRQAAKEIGKCEIFIANDNGLMHLADIMNVPVIAIFGMTEINKNRPWNQPNLVISRHLDCSPCYNRGEVTCSQIQKYACLDISPKKILQNFRKMEKKL